MLLAFSQMRRGDTVSGAKRAGKMALVGKARLEPQIRKRLRAIENTLFCPFEPLSPHVLTRSNSVNLLDPARNGEQSSEAPFMLQ